MPRGVSPLCSALSLSISSAVAHTSRLRTAMCPQAVGPAWPLFLLRPCWSHLRLNDNHSLPKALASTAPAACGTASVLHRSINKADNLGLVKVRGDPRADPPPKRGESITGRPVASGMRRQRSGHLGVVGRRGHPVEAKGEVCAPIRELAPQSLPGSLDGSQRRVPSLWGRERGGPQKEAGPGPRGVLRAA